MNLKIAVILLLLTIFFSCLSPGNQPDPGSGKTEKPKMVLKSSDGGQTWQDLSKGLPEDLPKHSIRGNSFFANEKGIFLELGNGIYHNNPNTADTAWNKEVRAGRPGTATSGIFSWGVNIRKANGTNVWSPILESSQEVRMRSVFESAGGAIYISTDGGLLKTVDNGKTWKRVHSQGMDGHLAESGVVLVGISMRKMIRSIDDGETWASMISGDAVSRDVKSINGGFAAITAGSGSDTTRLSTSYDGGKTWQVHSALQDKVLVDSISRTWNDRPRVQTFVTSILHVGESLFCTHHDGIFKSTDMGKTWSLVLPAVKDKVFYLFVSGDVIYAVAGKGGC